MFNGMLQFCNVIFFKINVNGFRMCFCMMVSQLCVRCFAFVRLINCASASYVLNGFLIVVQWFKMCVYGFLNVCWKKCCMVLYYFPQFCKVFVFLIVFWMCVVWFFNLYRCCIVFVLLYTVLYSLCMVF